MAVAVPVELEMDVDMELSSQVMSCKKLSSLSFILIELVAVARQVTTKVYPAEVI